MKRMAGSSFISSLAWLAFVLILMILHDEKVACSSSSSSPSSSHYANVSSSSAHRCSEQESSGLLDFKSSIIIHTYSSMRCDVYDVRQALHPDRPFSPIGGRSFPKTNNWEFGSDCCSWDGVTCDGVSGHVIKLDLSCSQLLGAIDCNSRFFQLRHLQSVNLAFNNFIRSKICSEFGRFAGLTYLNLSNSWFSGPIPLEISNLSKLVTLDVSGNQISGEIFPHISKLQNLSELILSGNSIGGIIPPSLFSLPSLENLQLGVNLLSGPLPSTITGLQKLNFLDLGNNMLNSSIPSALPALPSLRFLDLSSNKLVGQVAGFQSNLLEHINLSKNSLQGANFSSISNLVNLTLLDLSSNNLTGTLELDVFSHLQKLQSVDLSNNIHLSMNSSRKVNTPLPELSFFHMSNCNVSSFPCFLRNLVQLEKLDLSNNKIHDPLPEWLSVIGKSSLFSLNLSHNFLTSSIPILSWEKLQQLDLSFNFLQGALPIPASTLELYFISNNNLSGKIPPKVCNLSGIQLVNFSRNRLSGNIPDCLLKMESISVLDLRSNYFSGTIPEVIGGRLNTLDLSENQLIGHIPRSLANCTNLVILNLGDNSISDTFPCWLRTIPRLTILVLRSNRFYGSIAEPINGAAFSNLSVIDLSHNNFIGNLPSYYFNRWKMMMTSDSNSLNIYKTTYYSNSVTLMNKGQKMELFQILSIFKAVDFSNNNFDGKIPESISYLKSLIVLNLSSNGLTGEIPISLGNLNQLQSLDLSNNKLSGRIPQQLTNLTFLSAFSVSGDNLEGPIPQARQFSTFSNGSYTGNPRLCGIPLTKRCEYLPSSHQPTPLFEQDQNSDTILDGFTWKPVAIGFGCGAIIGMIIGQIIIRWNEEWVLSIFNIRLLWRIKKIQ